MAKLKKNKKLLEHKLGHTNGRSEQQITVGTALVSHKACESYVNIWLVLNLKDMRKNRKGNKNHAGKAADRTY